MVRLRYTMGTTKATTKSEQKRRTNGDKNKLTQSLQWINNIAAVTESQRKKALKQVFHTCYQCDWKKKAYDENFYCIKVWSWKHAVKVVKNIFMYTFQLFLLFILASIGCWPNAVFTPMYFTVRYGWYGLQPLSVAIETEKRSKVSIPNAPSFALTLYGFLSGNVNREHLLHTTALFFFSIHQSLATYKISIWSHWTHMDR